jgi:hypothetical protein
MKSFRLCALLLVVPIAMLVASCASTYEQAYKFDYAFGTDQEGWVTGFADLPANYDVETFALHSGWSKLPSGLEGGAVYLSGHNRSDDLFMYLQKHISGLKPKTTYQMGFSIALASNTPKGMVGIGGSPGESVFIKAGAVNFEPKVVTDSAGWLRLNIDKGNQAAAGKDAVDLGTIANPNLDPATSTGDTYAIMNLSNQGHPFLVTSDEHGSIWVIIGSDSGYEGLTTIYYHSIEINLVQKA